MHDAPTHLVSQRINRRWRVSPRRGRHRRSICWSGRAFSSDAPLSSVLITVANRAFLQLNGPMPSMRRPVSVKPGFSSSFLWVCCVRAELPLSPSFHPRSFVERLYVGFCDPRNCYHEKTGVCQTTLNQKGATPNALAILYRGKRHLGQDPLTVRNRGSVVSSTSRDGIICRCLYSWRP